MCGLSVGHKMYCRPKKYCRRAQVKCFGPHMALLQWDQEANLIPSGKQNLNTMPSVGKKILLMYLVASSASKLGITQTIKWWGIIAPLIVFWHPRRFVLFAHGTLQKAFFECSYLLLLITKTSYPNGSCNNNHFKLIYRLHHNINQTKIHRTIGPVGLLFDLYMKFWLHKGSRHIRKLVGRQVRTIIVGYC